MKLKELNDAIAASCNVRGNVVTAVQNETFRQLRAAIEKGEKVVVPEFGTFVAKDLPGENGEPAQKLIKFKARKGDRAEKKKARKEAKKKNKDAEGAAAPAAESGGEDGED